MNTKAIEFPETLIEAVRVFSDLDYATEFFANIRWGNGVCCPRCGSTNVLYMAKRRMWECRETHDKKQFSVKIGTIFEECRLPIDKCLIAVWLEVNAKNSISSYEIARHLGVTQKTGWFLLHRIRHALQNGSFESFSGEVESDETYVGGLAKNMHKSRRRQKINGTGGAGKAIVHGLIERGSEKRSSKVRAKVVATAKRSTLLPIIRESVQAGSFVYTDALKSYAPLSADYIHGVIDHAECYVKEQIHTNGMENFWSLFKRCIRGTHVNVEPFHLQAYLDSEIFRFNNRDLKDGGRFAGVLKGVSGKRLTYKDLTCGEPPEGHSSSDKAGESQLPN